MRALLLLNLLTLSCGFLRGEDGDVSSSWAELLNHVDIDPEKSIVQLAHEALGRLYEANASAVVSPGPRRGLLQSADEDIDKAGNDYDMGHGFGHLPAFSECHDLLVDLTATADRHYRSAINFDMTMDYPYYDETPFELGGGYPQFWTRTPQSQTVRQGGAAAGSSAAMQTEEYMNSGEDLFVIKWSQNPDVYYVDGADYIAETNCYTVMHAPLMRTEFLDGYGGIGDLCANDCFGVVARKMAELLNRGCFGTGGSREEGSARQAAASYAIACQTKPSGSYCIDLMGYASKACSSMKSSLGCCYRSFNAWMMLGSDETTEQWKTFRGECSMSTDICRCPMSIGVYERHIFDENADDGAGAWVDRGVQGFDALCPASTLSPPHAPWALALMLCVSLLALM